MSKLILTLSAVTTLSLAACTTTGNVERNTAIGAAGGAAAGAILGNNVGKGDAKTGAIIGGVAGAAGGAMVGNQKDKRAGEGTRLRRAANGQELFFDQNKGRYYYFDPANGRTYYENGELRG